MAFELTEALIRAPGFIIGITLHEWAHAQVAYRAGDRTPLHDGRLSLNPVQHLDPLGTLCLIFGPFGWGRAVRIRRDHFENPVWDSMRVALAGPLANLFVCIVVMLVAAILPVNLLFGPSLGRTVSSVLQATIQTNLVLTILNLVPVPPLDGFTVAQAFLPLEGRRFLEQANGVGGALILCFVLSGGLDPVYRYGLGNLKTLSAFGLLGVLPLLMAFLVISSFVAGPDRSS